MGEDDDQPTSLMVRGCLGEVPYRVKAMVPAAADANAPAGVEVRLATPPSPLPHHPNLLYTTV